jgi:hypothetical protein
LDDLDSDEAVDTGIVAGGAEEVGFRLVYDPFANGVLVDVGDPVHEEPGLAVFDPKGAAAVLPEMILLQPPEGLAVFFKTMEHPIATEVHFHFDGFQQGRGGISLEVPFERRRRHTVFCAEHEMEVAAHEAPGIEVEARLADEVVQCVSDNLFVGRSDK